MTLLEDSNTMTTTTDFYDVIMLSSSKGVPKFKPLPINAPFTSMRSPLSAGSNLVCRLVTMT